MKLDISVYRLAACLAVISLPIACIGDAVETETTREALVYGTDNRTDYYAHGNEALKSITSEATAAFVNNRGIDRSDPENVVWTPLTKTLDEWVDLCPSESFRDQPRVATAAGTLIDHNLVLTVGYHMTSDSSFCGTFRETGNPHSIVFDFYNVGPGTQETVSIHDVYTCKRIVAIAPEVSDTPWLRVDYAIIQLDRPAQKGGRLEALREPVTVLAEDLPTRVWDPVAVIGFPISIPAKIDDGAIVIYTRSGLLDYFGINADTFVSSGGSGVYNVENTLIGFVRWRNSRPDFVLDGDCHVVNTLPERGLYGEPVTGAIYVRRAIEALCETPDRPLTTLCGDVHVCGDGVCSGPETYVSCRDDCDPPVCGDDICHPVETRGLLDSPYSCREDCVNRGDGEDRSLPPPGWTCADGFYDSMDGCHCMCGVYDPDCDVEPIPAFNCEMTERCSEDGVCEPNPDLPDVPVDWTCHPDFYGQGDGCHCLCGAHDPDCDEADSEVLGCEEGQVCQDAECVEDDPDAGADAGDPDGGGDAGDPDGGGDAGDPDGGVDAGDPDGGSGGGESDGCGCRTVGEGGASSELAWPAVWLALTTWLIVRRRCSRFF